MARAELTVKRVERVTFEDVSDGVTLHLSDNEAEALVSVLRRVGGTPDGTRRGFTQAVLQALMGVGLHGNPNHDLEGYLQFDILPVNDPRRAELPDTGSGNLTFTGLGQL